MKNYKDYIISKGGKEMGLLFYDIKNFLLAPNEYEKFRKYMSNQTVGVLHIQYEDKVELASVIYTGDYERFIKGLQNND